MACGRRKRARVLQAFTAMSERSPIAAALGWGLFCSASWTWCIGMFLPFVMLQRYGWIGFWIFFVPNVIGCAGFGLLQSTERVRALRERLLPLCGWFSLVTIAYQAFFAGWMLPSVGGFAVVLGGLLSARLLRERAWLWMSVAVAVATGCAVAAHLRGGGWPTLDANGSRPASDVIALAPAVALGFLACPFLDLTFHRARLRSGSRLTFAVFGVAFGFTLLSVALWWSDALRGPVRDGALLALWSVQLAFTIGAHAREGSAPAVDGLARPAHLTALSAVWAALSGLALGWAVRVPEVGDFAGEWAYLALLGFYGLVFPFALLLRRRIPHALLIAVILVASPFYAQAFIGGRTAFLWGPIVALAVLWMATKDKDGTKGLLAS